MTNTKQIDTASAGAHDERVASSDPYDDVASMLLEILRAVRRSVAYDEGMAMSEDPDVMIPTQFASTFLMDPKIALLACGNEQRHDDVLKFSGLASRTVPVATLSVGFDAECESSPRWQQLLLPRGRRHELRAALVDPHGVCWGALALYRRGETRFSPSDVESVRRLVPNSATRLARAMVTVRLPGIPAEPGSLLIRESGQVVGASQIAERWLGEVRQGDTVDRVAMSLAALAARVERVDAPPAVSVRMRSPGGAWTTLSAQPIVEGEFERLISVVLMATSVTQLLPLQIAAFGLTEREADVVLCVLRGLDTKAIAAKLCISALTVQDHLKSVFSKTDVRSRRELTRLLGSEFR